MSTPSLADALAGFSTYQHAENQPKYARAVCARVAEFVDHCSEYGVKNLDQVELRHVRDWLRRTPKKTNPGAWKTRHLATQTFFNWCVFVGLMNANDNPLATSPRGATLTNKPMLGEADFRRLLLVIPSSHMGIQHKIACLLLWHGYTLRQANALVVSDVESLPDDVRMLAGPTLRHRHHAENATLWMDQHGNPRTLHGQKLNKRLQKYAATADLTDPTRVSASLIHQSGNYHRLTQEESW